MPCSGERRSTMGFSIDYHVFRQIHLAFLFLSYSPTKTLQKPPTCQDKANYRWLAKLCPSAHVNSSLSQPFFPPSQSIATCPCQGARRRFPNLVISGSNDLASPHGNSQIAIAQTTPKQGYEPQVEITHGANASSIIFYHFVYTLFFDIF